MLKKILATALAAAMIFGLANVAFAATFSDVAGNKNEAAIKRLAAVGIFGGYPDGTFKPANPITRAEFSKIVVMALGLGDTAEMMATVPTGFSDVSVDHWANGFISIAASQGIVKGDPAGTFRPDANVTYAEAVTMVMRALGYEPVCKNGVWPTAYLTKATSIGIIGSLSFVASAPATRGDVATLLSNSLTEPWLVETEWDANGNPVRFAPDENQFFLDAMGFEKSGTAVLVDSPELFGNDGETVRQLGQTAQTLAADTEYAGLLGHRVVFWFDDNDDVFFIENKTSASDIRVAEFDDVDAAAEEVLVEIDDESVNVNDLPMILNYGEATDIDDDDAATLPTDGDEITVTYYDGDPIFVMANRWSFGVVSSVSTARERITFKSGDASGLTLEDWDVTWIGDVADLADIEEDDVVQFIKDDDAEKAIIQVTRDTVTGELERVNPDVDEFRVDGTWYDAAASFEMDDDDVKAMLDSDVTLILDKNGEVQYILEAEEDAETFAGLVIDIAEDSGIWGSDTLLVKLFTAEGELEEFEVSDDYDYVPAPEGIGYDDNDDSDYVDADDFIVRVGDVIEYELDEDVLEAISIEAVRAEQAVGLDVDDEDSLLEWPLGGSNYKLTGNTVVFWAVDYDGTPDDADDLEIGTVDDVLDNSTIDGYVGTASGKVAYVVVTTASGVPDKMWGVVLESWQEDSDTYGFSLVNPDGDDPLEFTTDEAAALTFGESDVVVFDPSGTSASGLVYATEYGGLTGTNYWVVTSVSDGVIRITEYNEDGDPFDTDINTAGVQKDQRYLLVDEDTLYFYDKPGSTNPVAIELEDVSVGSHVEVYTENAGDSLIKVLVTLD
ncbi:MAG: S-layer homology domain-containing protein [Bacillota bacterium]